jgi:hypothetical protein
MSPHFRVRRAALWQLRRMPAGKRWLSALCWALLIGRECAALPPVPFVGPDPADPYVSVPAASYRSVIAPYVSLRPAKPGNWQQQNQRAAPQGAPAHHH